MEDQNSEIYSLLNLAVDVDILCYTPDKMERMRNRGFMKKILSEEVVLYEKRAN